MVIPTALEFDVKVSAPIFDSIFIFCALFLAECESQMFEHNLDSTCDAEPRLRIDHQYLYSTSSFLVSYYIGMYG